MAFPDVPNAISLAEEVVGDYVEKGVESNERMAGIMAQVFARFAENPIVGALSCGFSLVYKSEADSFLDF